MIKFFVNNSATSSCSTVKLNWFENIELIQFVLRSPWLLRFNLIIISHSSTCITHTYQHAPSKWLSRVSSPPRVDSKLLLFFGILMRFSRLRFPAIYFFFYNDFVSSLPSLFIRYFFFFLFIQRIHRCGYTKLERYYFCLHVNNSMSRVVCNAIVNTRVSLVSISMSRSMVLSNVLTSNRSFERYIFALLLSLFFFFFLIREKKKIRIIKNNLSKIMLIASSKNKIRF